MIESVDDVVFRFDRSCGVRCSFCDARESERECIAAGPKGLAICDVCIAYAATNCAAACGKPVAQWIADLDAELDREIPPVVQ